MTRWLIWSEEHGRWWRGGQWGYTTSLAQAGRYSEAEAKAIVRKANFTLTPPRFHEVAIPDPLPQLEAERAEG